MSLIKTTKTKPSADSGVKLLLSPSILMCLVFFTLLSLGSTGIASFLIVALGQHHGTAVETATLILSTYLVLGAVGVLLAGLLPTERENIMRLRHFVFCPRH